MARPHNSGCALRTIFIIWHNQRGQRVYEIYISSFSTKDLVESELVILGPKMLCPQNSRTVLKYLYGETQRYRISSLKRRGVYKIPKVLGAAFIGGGVY